MTDFTELKKLAQCATQGMWACDGENVNEHGNLIGAYVAHEDGGRIAEAFANCLVKTDEQCRSNAAYIAAASPAAILELLADNQSLRGSCKRMGEDFEQQARALKRAERELARARAAGYGA